jgi:hypothetical protein
LSLDRDYEYNENNRMKKDKEVVWVSCWQSEVH